MAAAQPLKSRFANAAKKAVAQAKQGVVQTVKTEAAAAVENVGEQVGIPPEILAAQQKEQKELAEMEAYKQQVKQKEEQKMAQLRAALQQHITGGIQEASAQRQQTEQQYAQRTEQQFAGSQPATQQEAEQIARANRQKQQIEQQMRGKKEMGRGRKG